MIPSQFGDTLEQFAKSFAQKEEDGVFRYEPPQVDEATRNLAETEDTEGWFNTESSPEIAEAVAAANAVANKPIDPEVHEIVAQQHSPEGLEQPAGDVGELAVRHRDEVDG